MSINRRNILRMMLQDAILWQESYLDAVEGTEYRDEAEAQLKAYRDEFKRRYGTTRDALDGATLVSLQELQSQQKNKK